MQNRDRTPVPKEYEEWSLHVDPELLRVLRGRYNPEAGNRAFAQALGAASTDAALSKIGRLLGYSCFTPEKAPKILKKIYQNIYPGVDLFVPENTNKSATKIKINKGSAGAPKVIHRIWHTAGIQMQDLPPYVFAIAELYAIELLKTVSLPIEELSLDLLLQRELGGHQNPFCLALNGKKQITANVKSLLAADTLYHRNSRKAQQSREAKLALAREQYPHWEMYQAHLVELFSIYFSDYVMHGQGGPKEFWDAVVMKFEHNYAIIKQLRSRKRNPGVQYIAYAIEDGKIKSFEFFQSVPNLDQLCKLATSGTTSLNWGVLFRTGADGIPRVVDQPSEISTLMASERARRRQRGRSPASGKCQ